MCRLSHASQLFSLIPVRLFACSPKAAKKMTTVRAFQASTDLSEEELVDAVTKSSKSAAVGVVKVRKFADRRRALLRACHLGGSCLLVEATT